jgi:Flp pilus assembly protein TadG
METQYKRRSGEHGQALVVFVLALVAIIGMTGLVLDGGGAFAQRRVQQNVADLAAFAAVTAFANTSGAYAAKDNAGRQRALDIAATNGYPDGANNTQILVTGENNATNGSQRYHVTVLRPHQNNFAGLLGQPVWDVGASATAVTGYPNAAIGAMPLIFNELAFDELYDPKAKKPGEEFGEPGNGPGDLPLDATSFNWTVYCTANGNECNGNSNTVRDLIEQHGEKQYVHLGMAIGPLNAGAHTTLFGDMEQWTCADPDESDPGMLAKCEFPVAIVCTKDNRASCPRDGAMVGWAIFHLTAVQGSNRKVVIGYFTSGVNNSGLTISPDAGQGGPFGGYVIKIIE